MADRKESGWTVIYKDETGKHHTIVFAGTASEEAQIKQEMLKLYGNVEIVSMIHPNKTGD